MEQTPANHSTQTILALPPAHEWLQLINEENVQLVILDSHLDSELIEIIRLQPEWKVDSEDDELVIFTLAER